MLLDLDPLLLAERLAIAGLIGLVVGTEREWSGPPDGPQRRFAGLRTFLLFGLLGGIAGLLIAGGATAPGTILLAAGLLFNVVAYAMSVRRPHVTLDATTESAALVVLALGALAGVGYLMLAAGCGAVVVFALGEKQRLHGYVNKIGQPEMHAALEFLVLALVVLPILPAGPYDNLLGFRPRALWAVVLILTGINFASYLARRMVGPGKGYTVTGALAGLVSSTALTMQFSRLSRAEPKHARSLSLGVLAACTMLPMRIVVMSLFLNPDVALQLLYFAVPAAAVGAAFILLRRREAYSNAAPEVETRSPLRLMTALQLAVVFQVTFLVIDYARSSWGNAGLTGSSLLFGTTDLDALTVSLSRQTGDASVAHLAALGIGIGLFSNTISKMVIALTLGEKHFKRLTAVALATMAVVLAAVLWWRW